MSVTVLVVDDASFVRDLVKRAVRRLLPQAEILEAHDGSRAQALMRQRPVDLILSDWEMPEMSGEELLRWVRQNEASANTPFVMISSRGDRNHVVQAINAGVNDYLTKPFTADELMRKLLKQFQRMGIQTGELRQRDGSGTGNDSASILTGATARRPAQQKNIQAAAQFAAPMASNAAPQRFRGRAQIRLAAGSAECEVRDISLQALTGVVDRSLNPALFESAVVDLELDDGQTLARLNAYVHLLQAAQPNPAAERIKVVLRFVDKDPAKLEALSKCLTQ